MGLTAHPCRDENAGASPARRRVALVLGARCLVGRRELRAPCHVAASTALSVFISRLPGRRACRPLGEWEGLVIRRLVERCAGLDVHKASVTATVRVPAEG